MSDLRSEFPVFERVSYLNAGTNGPVPRRAIEAATASLALQAERGRGGSWFFEPLQQEWDRLRGRVARLFRCDPGEVALTGSTTDGINAVLSSLELGRGDEILTSDAEHPGLVAPLAVARERRGVTVRAVPLAELPGAIGPATKLVACSHVSWVTGEVVDAPALVASGVPLLLDGAQGLGAVPLDMAALGCDFYAASGQKWLCGPIGSGYLYVRRERCEELLPPWAGYPTVAEAGDGLHPVFHDDARRLDVGYPAAEEAAWALAALDVLEAPGIESVQERATTLAARLADALRERGLTVAPRGDSTLVSFEADDPEATVKRLEREGFVLRFLPGTPYVRVSVGGWSDEDELDRLVAAVVA